MVIEEKVNMFKIYEVDLEFLRVMSFFEFVGDFMEVVGIKC